MRAYTAFSRSDGPSEGAFLVFAETAKSAKKLVWSNYSMDFIDWIDLGIRWIKDPQFVLPLAEKWKLDANIPHVIINPTHCVICNQWGHGLDENDNCRWCGQEPGKDLHRVFYDQ